MFSAHVHVSDTSIILLHYKWITRPSSGTEIKTWCRCGEASPSAKPPSATLKRKLLIRKVYDLHVPYQKAHSRKNSSTWTWIRHNPRALSSLCWTTPHPERTDLTNFMVVPRLFDQLITCQYISLLREWFLSKSTTTSLVGTSILWTILVKHWNRRCVWWLCLTRNCT